MSETVQIVHQLFTEFTFSNAGIQKTIQLLNEGNTVPFIARYRKEATGGLDETQIHDLEERYTYLIQLEQRKEEVMRLIDEQGKLSDELRTNIGAATKLQEVEDYYRPYRQKRRTRATIAKEKGLDGLADFLLAFSDSDPLQESSAYINEEKEVLNTEQALQGAMDIIAEMIADDPDGRQWIRTFTYERGTIMTVAKDSSVDEDGVYTMYYDFSETVSKSPAHRILAMNRGEKEGVLRVRVHVEESRVLDYLRRQWIKHTDSPCAPYVQEALEEAYRRLIAPAVERDIRRELTEKAEEQAIDVFAKNARSLLLQPPLKGKTVLGVDPAFRTGCKLAVVDPTGKLLQVAVIYPTAPYHKEAEAMKKLDQLMEAYPIDVVAIGNGTASRETEQFIADWIGKQGHDLAFSIINEAGASVYSASSLAREEFPDLDVAERSAVSIARRLQDPLAELVKIDPRSIGVGQYQHDVSQKKLAEGITFVVETAVNQVGVDVNTASVSLLQYVSGLNKSVANQIVKRRDEQGPYTNRRQLLDVPRLGAKTYEQSIGFLRIRDGDNPFDRTPIHPESYMEAEHFLHELGCQKEEIGTATVRQRLQDVQVKEWADQLGMGEPTLADIIQACKQPQRDPRDELPKPLLQTDVLQLDDLSEGMQLEGTVRNVVDFGAFVDIGLKNDGLVHISQLSDRYVRHPMEVVSVGDIVTVWVISIDQKRGRIGLTMVPGNEQGNVNH